MGRSLPRPSTLYDLYVERNTLPWYFRVLATTGIWAILAGYLVLAFAATSNPKDLRPNKATLVIAGTTVLVLGHVLAVSVYLYARSWLFRIDVVLVPALLSSSIGFLAVLLNQKLHRQIPFNQPLVYLPILFSALVIIASALLAAWIYRRIRTVRTSDNRRREPRGPYQDAGVWRPNSTDSAALKLLPDLPDDELQRQQLERLLLKQDTRRAPSPEAQSNTYRIDLPSPYPSNQERHLSVPDSAGRARSYSDGSNHATSTWKLRSLLPGKKHPLPVWKDARERRREEIERGGNDPGTALLRMPASAHDGWSAISSISPPTKSNAYRYA